MNKFFFLRFFLLINLFLFQSIHLFAQDEFDSIDQLYDFIEKGEYILDIDRVSAPRFPNTIMFNPSGEVEVNDSIVTGRVPFFGRLYSVPVGSPNNGIEIKDKMFGLKISKKKKYVLSTFSVRSNSEIFRFSINFYTNGRFMLILSSTHRENNTYEGYYKELNIKTED